MNGRSSVSYLARTPCVSLFCTSFNRVETEGLLDYQGRAGIISIVRWNLRPVIFGVESMGGRPGHRTMEINGRSSVSYLARTPCVPLFCTSFNRVETEGLLDFFTRGGRGSFPLYGGTSPRSYSVSKVWVDDRGTGQWKCSVSCLARTPCVPLFCTSFNRVETEGLLEYQGSFPLYGGTFARSYLVSKYGWTTGAPDNGN